MAEVFFWLKKWVSVKNKGPEKMNFQNPAKSDVKYAYFIKVTVPAMFLTTPSK